jgi:N-acetylglucosamine kinase-like BadF-type ATPase
VTDGLLLGIDGGGSKVLVALADRAGHIIRTALGGGVNPMDNRNWREELAGPLRSFIGEPGLAAVGAALPAHGEVDALSQSQREAIAAAFPGVPQAVINDVDGAHIGAFAGGPGILILSGTGSMAWARDTAGNSYRVGGWGDVIGDEGSGHWIGQRALGLISQSLDGRAGPTPLVDAAFDYLGLDRSKPASSLEGWVAGFTNLRAGVASLAVVVDQLAQAGDRDARALIDAAADELVKHVVTIAPRCGSPAEWTYAGGAFASRALLDAVTERLGRPPVPPRLPPIGGALLSAAMRLGWPIEPAFVEQLAVATDAAMANAKRK